MQLFHPQEEAALRARLETPGPDVVVVSGPRRVGKTALVRRVVQERRRIWFRGSPLPPPLLARDHTDRLPRDGLPTPSVAGWADFGIALLDRIREGALDGAVLVWDRADTLLRDPRWRQMLDELWSELRVHARPLHLVLILRDAPAPETLSSVDAPGAPLLELPLSPLSLREAARGFEGWSPLERLTAYAVVGGEPTVWNGLDPGSSLATNLIRLFLEPGAPLRRFVRDRFPLPGRNPERALALVDALARGAREWGELKEEAGVFKTSSELGPYMKALRKAGLMESRRPLDAPPGSRRRRHRPTAPLLASWHALFRATLGELDGGGDPETVWKERIAPRLGPVVSRRLPELLADHLRRHGEEHVRARARETGGIWGEGPEIEVAGTLANGATVYGLTSWEDPGPEAVERLARQVMETRYGYGRESRTLILFVGLPVAWTVERSVARRDDAILLGPRDLLGNGAGGGE